MAEKELKEALDKLVEELQSIDQSDTESREMLKQLVESIELKLNEPDNKEHHSHNKGCRWRHPFRPGHVVE